MKYDRLMIEEAAEGYAAGTPVFAYPSHPAAPEGQLVVTPKYPQPDKKVWFCVAAETVVEMPEGMGQLTQGQFDALFGYLLSSGVHFATIACAMNAAGLSVATETACEPVAAQF